MACIRTIEHLFIGVAEPINILSRIRLVEFFEDPELPAIELRFLAGLCALE